LSFLIFFCPKVPPFFFFFRNFGKDGNSRAVVLLSPGAPNSGGQRGWFGESCRHSGVFFLLWPVQVGLPSFSGRKKLFFETFGVVSPWGNRSPPLRVVIFPFLFLFHPPAGDPSILLPEVVKLFSCVAGKPLMGGNGGVSGFFDPFFPFFPRAVFF